MRDRAILWLKSAGDRTQPANTMFCSVAGELGCKSWDDAWKNLTSDKVLSDRASANKDFYQRLSSTAPLQGVLDPAAANFWNADYIYQLVNYMYTHNETVYKGLGDANKTLDTLREDSITLQRAKTQAPSSNSNDTQSIVRTLPGRTLAHTVAVQLDDFAVRGGYGVKLTLMFGSYEPLMAFYSVAGLLTRDNVDGPLGNITAPGAMIVFELIGENPNDAATRPDTDDLRVRFLYRPTADKDENFQVLSLFGSGFDGNSIPYTAFKREMMSRGRDAVDWCELCNPSNISTWCSPTSSSSHHTVKSQMNPAVAGVIGAVVMGGLIALVGLGLFCIGGYGIRRGRNGDGFKGPEKKSSDRDVHIGDAGDQQERIGSWEMRDGQATKASAGDALTPAEHQRNPFDDDAASDIGAAPVKAREGV